jgi:acetolactate synthase-1/2/3 large subunit
MARSAGEDVVEVLAARGVRRFYTVPGESFLEVLDAVERDSRLQLISCRHESGAAFMVEAEGKLTGRPAVATRAVGAANLSIGVLTAWEDCTPMLALCGQVETGSIGRRAFQEVDLPSFSPFPQTCWPGTARRTHRDSPRVGSRSPAPMPPAWTTSPGYSSEPGGRWWCSGRGRSGWRRAPDAPT